MMGLVPHHQSQGNPLTSSTTLRHSETVLSLRVTTVQPDPESDVIGLIELKR